MDLTGMIQNPVEDQNSEQKLSKEEYAALKKQERKNSDEAERNEEDDRL